MTVNCRENFIPLINRFNEKNVLHYIFLHRTKTKDDDVTNTSDDFERPKPAARSSRVNYEIIDPSAVGSTNHDNLDVLVTPTVTPVLPPARMLSTSTLTSIRYEDVELELIAGCPCGCDVADVATIASEPELERDRSVAPTQNRNGDNVVNTSTDCSCDTIDDENKKSPGGDPTSKRRSLYDNVAPVNQLQTTTYSAAEPVNLTRITPYDEIDQFIVAHPPPKKPLNISSPVAKAENFHPGGIFGRNYEPNGVGADEELKRSHIEATVADGGIRSPHPLEGRSEDVAETDNVASTDDDATKKRKCRSKTAISVYLEAVQNNYDNARIRSHDVVVAVADIGRDDMTLIDNRIYE